MGEITAQHDTIAALYDPDEFVGRGWLKTEAERLRVDPGRRRLVIVGEPGSGKSTFLAWLAHAWNCPRYFIRGGSVGGVTGTDPHSFLISLGQQLYQRYGRELFDSGAERSTVVRTRRTTGEAEVIGRFVEELYTLPFVSPARETVEVRAGVTSGAARVVGEQIGRLVDVTKSLDVRTLLHVALLDPIRRLSELHPDEVVVILIDALDAAAPPGRLASAQEPGIADIVAQMSDLECPANLRLLMTSRRGDHLASFTSGELLHLDDTANDYAQRQSLDTREYIKRNMESGPAAPVVRDWPGENVQSLASRLLARSDGNFLYLRFFFLSFAEITRTWTGPVEQLPVPHGLDDIYRTFAVQNIKGSATFDEWKYSLPLLGVLAVLREPVDRLQLADFAGVEHEYADFIIAKLRPFLDVVPTEKKDRYRLYHDSFAEYLIDATRNQDYPISAKKYHALLTAFYFDKFGAAGEAAGWPLVTDGYALRNLSFHANEAESGEALFQLIESRSWFDSQMTYDPSGARFAEDALLAWSAVELEPAAFPAEADKPQVLQRVLEAALAYCSVRSLSRAVDGRLLAELVKRHMWTPQQAFSAVSQVADDRTVSGMLTELAPYLPGEYLGPALARAIPLGQETDYNTALIALAPRLTGKHRSRALEAGKAISKPLKRAEVLASLATSDDPDPAAAGLEAAVSMAAPWERLPALVSVLAHLDPGDRARAMCAAAATEEAWRTALLVGQVAGNEVSYAETVAKLAGLTDQPDREDLLNRALTIARAVTDAGHIAPESQGDYQGPHTLVLKLRDTPEGTRHDPHPGTRAIALATLAPLLAPSQRGNVVTEAIDAARRLPAGSDRRDTWVQVVTRLGEYGRDFLQEALENVGDIGDWHDYHIALLPALPVPERVKLAVCLMDASLRKSNAAVRGRQLGAVVAGIPDLFTDAAVSKAVTESRVIGDYQQQAVAFGLLVAGFTEGRRAEVLSAIETDFMRAAQADERASGELAGLITTLLRAGEYGAAVSRAKNMNMGSPGTVQQLPGHKSDNVLVLAAVAAHLEADERDAWILSGVQALSNSLGFSFDAAAWRSLVEIMSPGLSIRAKEIADGFPMAEARALGLAALSGAADAPPDSVKEAILALSGVGHDMSRAGIISAFAGNLQADDRQELVSIARQLQTPEAAAEALAGLSRGCQAPERARLLSEALDLLATAPGESRDAGVLAELAAGLPAELRPAALRLARRVANPGSRAYAMASVLTLSPEPWQPQDAGQMLRDVESGLGDGSLMGDLNAAKALAIVAGQLDGPSLRHAFSLSARLPGTGKADVLSALSRAAARLQPAEAYQIATETIRRAAAGHRGEAIWTIAAMRPVFTRIAGTSAHEILYDEILAAATRWP
jgi:hypothetical protein